MALKNLVQDILSGELAESNQSFKSVMVERLAEKLQEKKKGRYDKDLDKNHNGKLDSDDFKILRGQKCSSACEEVELDEAKKASPITGTRKIATFEGDHGHKAEVRYSSDWNEYQVHHYKDGKHLGEKNVSYHGDDKQDAIDTAKHEVGVNEEIELDEGRKSFRAGYNKAKKRYSQLYQAKESTELDEVLDPSQGVGSYIDDFQKSKDPRFSGDSKEQRRKRAIAAFYADKKK